MYQLTYEQKKEKFISVLNNHFGSHDVFPEIANISDEDFRKIIELYEQKASVGGKDPWHYLYFDELIIMQQTLYEVIKTNYSYSDITAKVEKLFEQELDRRLQRPVLSYGEETGETYRVSYTEMPEYAMTLADMCIKNMIPDKKTFEEKKNAIDKYQQIREDFIKAGKKMPMSYETTLEYAQGNMARRYVGGTPKESPIEPVLSAENNREANLRELREMPERKAETPIHTETEQTKIDAERQQAQVNEKEQKRIYNLIHKAENERLQRSRSLYTAWDLGNKTIPPEYQGMTYEQVEAILNQKEDEEKARQEAKATRDELIDKAIRKGLNVPEDYHLSQIQIQNLSQQFAGYSDDELRKFIFGVKKQETVPEFKQETSVPSYSDFEKDLISFIEKNNSNLGNVSEIISVTGYPDSTYVVRFDDGSIHQITITQEEKNSIRNQIQTTPEGKAKEVQQTITPNEQIQQKDKLISDILSAMLNVGEFHNSGLDISQKMSDLEYAKSKLQTKSLEELEYILSVYIPQQEETISSGVIKR